MSLVLPEKFQHILRIYNTNVEGDQSAGIALTGIKGIGRRFANVVLKKAGIPSSKRAGELTNEEIDKIMDVTANPLNYNIPKWMLNRQHDPRDGKYTHLVSNQLDARLRDDLNLLRKIRCNRGLRHFWGLKVRGQHTKTTGRRGNAVGVSKRKA